jgi:ABC-type nickel/cobalt efflux system permease component RcnA
LTIYYSSLIVHISLMVNSAIFVLGLGFVLGVKHATEADHLVAVTTIVSEQRSVWRAGAVGALWGVGHTASLFVAGLVVILLGYTIPARVAALLEMGVALMIVLLGTRILFLLLRDRRRVHIHTHAHGGGRTHTHLHFHDERDAHSASRPHTHDGEGHKGFTGWRPLLVGAVHGLAGSAALTLLVLTEVVHDGSRLLGLSYLLIFGVGSVGGMLLLSTLISLPFIFTSARYERVNTPIRLVAGLGSVAFGLYYAWQQVAGV